MIPRIKRENGLTVVDFGNVIIRTNKINRFRFNDLKKRINNKEMVSLRNFYKWMKK